MSYSECEKAEPQVTTREVEGSTEEKIEDENAQVSGYLLEGSPVANQPYLPF